MKGLETCKKILEEVNPDCIVFVGGDHLRAQNLGNMPLFLICIGQTSRSIGDFCLPKVQIKNQQKLAQHKLKV